MWVDAARGPHWPSSQTHRPAGLLRWLKPSLGTYLMEDARGWERSGVRVCRAELPQFFSSYSSPGEGVIPCASYSWQGGFPGKMPGQTAPVSTLSTTVELQCGKGEWRGLKWRRGRQRAGGLPACPAEGEQLVKSSAEGTEKQRRSLQGLRTLLRLTDKR